MPSNVIEECLNQINQELRSNKEFANYFSEFVDQLDAHKNSFGGQSVNHQQAILSSILEKITAIDIKLAKKNTTINKIQPNSFAQTNQATKPQSMLDSLKMLFLSSSQKKAPEQVSKERSQAASVAIDPNLSALSKLTDDLTSLISAAIEPALVNTVQRKP